MDTMELVWSEIKDLSSSPTQQIELIDSVTKLTPILEEIHKTSRYPVLVQLFSDHNSSMIIGLGHQTSVLAYYADNDSGPFYWSLNPAYYNTPLDVHIDSVDFFYFGSDTEIIERYFIAPPIAINGICEFVTVHGK